MWPHKVCLLRCFSFHVCKINMHASTNLHRKTHSQQLGENLRRIGRQLRNSDDIDALRTLDRSTWRDLGRELA